MKVFVTGAGGFIGRHLCRRLCAEGHGVVALVRRPERIPEQGVAFVVGDLLDLDALARCLAEHGAIDAIVHLATEPPGVTPRTGANVAGTENLLHAAQRAGVGHIVYTSTMSVFDFLARDLPPRLPEDHPTDPRDEYSSEKLAGEMILQAGASELPVTILRLAGVFGPGKAAGAVHAFLTAALQDESIVIETDRAVDLLWIGDAVEAVVRALRNGPLPLLHIGSGQAVQLSDLAHRAIAAGGAGGTRTASMVCGPRGNSFCLDIRRARQAIDFRPTPLDEALRQQAAHLQQVLAT